MGRSRPSSERTSKLTRARLAAAAPGPAVEHLLAYVENGTVLAGRAPADGLREVGRAHGPPTVKDEWSRKPVKSNADVHQQAQTRLPY